MARRQERRYGQRRYRRRFEIICEGAVTEPCYFQWLKRHVDKSQILINIVNKRHSQSAPSALIKVAQEWVRDNGYDFSDKDRIWIVLDQDQWTDAHFLELVKWKEERSYHRVAVSKPFFEYWILLHQEEDPKAIKDHLIKSQYKAYMGSEKGIDESKLSLGSVRRAAERARQRFVSGMPSLTRGCDEFLPNTRGSSLFLLIDELEDYFLD